MVEAEHWFNVRKKRKGSQQPHFPENTGFDDSKAL